MNQVCAIIPAVFQAEPLLRLFRRNLSTFSHSDLGRIIVVCNRLTLMPGQILQEVLSADTTTPVQVVCEMERSVAGAWNRGIQIGLTDGFQRFLITAIDVCLRGQTIDALLRFGDRHPDTDLWSSTNDEELCDFSEKSVEHCDFSCFMLREGTIQKHGWFDKEYKPAYFEDVDYTTRVVLRGGTPRQVTAARHVHQKSATIRLDPEMAHHVAHWFGRNRARFLAKWNFRSDSYEEIRRYCFQSPYNSGHPLSWWPEQDRLGYSPAGGIHE